MLGGFNSQSACLKVACEAMTHYLTSQRNGYGHDGWAD